MSPSLCHRPLLKYCAIHILYNILAIYCHFGILWLDFGGFGFQSSRTLSSMVSELLYLLERGKGSLYIIVYLKYNTTFVWKNCFTNAHFIKPYQTDWILQESICSKFLAQFILLTVSFRIVYQTAGI